MKDLQQQAALITARNQNLQGAKWGLFKNGLFLEKRDKDVALIGPNKRQLGYAVHVVHNDIWESSTSAQYFPTLEDAMQYVETLHLLGEL